MTNNKTTATFREMASAITEELRLRRSREDQAAKLKCIDLLRDIRQDGHELADQSEWLASVVPGLTVERAEKLSASEMLSLLRRLKWDRDRGKHSRELTPCGE